MKQLFERTKIVESRRGESIDQVDGGFDGEDPTRGRHVGLVHEGFASFYNVAMTALRGTILLRGMRSCGKVANTVFCEVRAKGDKFTSIIRVYIFQFQGKVSFQHGEKLAKNGSNIRLAKNRKQPTIFCKMIHKENIVLVPICVNYWGWTPYISIKIL